MAEILDELPQRDDRSQSGRFLFENNLVGYCDDGIDGLKHYAPFDQGDWMKANIQGECSYKKGYDSGTSRIYEKLGVNALSAGVAQVQLRRRLLLPWNFGELYDGCLTLFTYRTTAVTHFELSTLQSGSGLETFDVSPASTSTWEAFTLTPAVGTFERGAFLTLILDVETADVTTEAWIADLAFGYKSARGNV